LCIDKRKHYVLVTARDVGNVLSALVKEQEGFVLVKAALVRVEKRFGRGIGYICMRSERKTK
jgi:hypothetical protein